MLRSHVERLHPRFLMSVTPAGTEFLLNQTTTDLQLGVATAIDPSGTVTAVWQSSHQDGSGYGIYGRQFNSSGTPIGPEFLVSQTTTGDQTDASIARSADGDFVVVWRSTQSGQPQLYGRKFSATGTAISNEFLINSSTTTPSTPVVAIDAGGNFVVAWEGSGAADSDGIYYRLFDENQQPKHVEELVNTNKNGPQSQPSVALDSAGNIVVGWTDFGGSISKVKGQRITAADQEAGGEFLVGTTGADSEEKPSVGIDAGGNFAIAFQSHFPVGTGWDVDVRRYDAAGMKLDANPILVNKQTTGAQNDASLAMRDDGSFVIAYTTGLDADGLGNGVYAQAFRSNGAKDGAEFRVNSTTRNNQKQSSVTWNGNFVAIAWEGNGVGDSSGVFARQYNAGGPTPNRAPTLSVRKSHLDYTEKDAPAAIAPTLVAADPDNAQFAGATVHLNDYIPGEDILGFANQFGIAGTWDATAGTLTLSGQSSIAHYQAAIRSVTYVNTSSDPSEAVRAAEIVVNDGAASSAPLVVAINVNAVDDAPIIWIPAGQATTEDATLVFSAANGNPIVLTDADDHGGIETVRLVPSHGTLSLATTNNLTLTRSNAYSDTTIVMSGTLADINAALDGLTFKPYADEDGVESVQVASMWSGSNHFTIQGTFVIGIAPEADAPTVENSTTEPGVQTSTGLAIQPNPADDGSHTWFKITDISGGVLFHHDGVTPVNDGDFIDVTEGTEGLKFTPASGVTAGSFNVQAATTANDSGLGGATVTARVNVVAPVVGSGQTPEPLPTDEHGQGTLAGSGRTTRLKERRDSVANASNGAEAGSEIIAVASPSVTPANSLAASQAITDVTLDETNVRGFTVEHDQNLTLAAKETRTENRGVGNSLSEYGTIKIGNSDLMEAARARSTWTPTVLTGGSAMWVALDDMHGKMTSNTNLRVMTGTATFVSVGMSVAYFLWVVRAGSMLSSLVSSIPAWKSVDPLPILDQMGGGDGDDDEGLDTLVGNGRKRIRSTVFNGAGNSEI